MEMYRQGDILLVEVEALPADAVDITSMGQRIYLASNRKTGQSHGVPATVARLFAVYPVSFDYDRPRERFLKVFAACSLEHDEHDAIPLAPGIYRVIKQRRYDPSGWLNVAD
jgi:hypothetical protein